MKRAYFIFFILIISLDFSQVLFGQIYEPEGINMPGSWDSWNQPPSVSALASEGQATGTIVYRDMGVDNYHTIIAVAASGADIVGGTYDWLFTSGPTIGYYNNKWGSVTVSMNTIQSYTKEGSNNSITVANGNWYIMNFQDNNYTNTNAIFMETSAAPVTLDALSYSPSGTIEPWDEVEVTITTSAAPCAEENVFVRYTTDGYSTSTLLEVAFVGTTGTATIPALPATTNVSFYAYSTTLASGDIGANHDMVTINYINNSGSNYSYVVNDPDSYPSAQAGDFSDVNTWGGASIPPSEKALVINHAIVMDADYAASEVTINSGGELSFNGTETLTIRGNGSWVNDGSFSAGNGTLVFQDNVSVGGTNNSVFNNVTVSGLNVDFDNPVTDISGVLKITTGSVLNAPELLSGSTLQYEQGGFYNRVTEWNNPYNVLVANNTDFDLNIDELGSDITVLGDLTINSGSSVDMGVVTGEYDLIVNGNLDIEGTLALSSIFGSDLQLKGNWSRTGIFTSNTRSVSLNGTSNQSITGATTFDYLIVDKSGGTVNLNDNIEVSNILTLTNGIIDGNGNTITISDDATSAIAGGSSSSYFVGTMVRGIKQIAKDGKSSKGDVYLFPIGTATSYNPATVDFTTLPSSAGTITASFSSTLDPAYESGLPMTDGSQEIDHLADGGYWQLTPSGLADYTYDLTIQGSDFVDDPAYEITNADGLRLLVRDDFSSAWQFLGSHGSGVADPPSVSRTGITGAMGIIAMGGLFSENPLPVSLSYFTVQKSPNGVKLQWETLSEKNNDKFEVYRSTNSIDYTKIATIDGAGYSSEKIKYDYIDFTAREGLNYYFLRQMDFDGQFTNSDVKVIDNQSDDSFDLSILNGQIKLQLNSDENKSLQYQIVDMKGLIVKEGMLRVDNKNSVIDIPNFNELFLIRVYSDSGFNYVRKISTIGIK
ncbi:MAG: hypothetical protein C0599_10920 [Salinivirgaceae bacterium]|nr:MAG: hypothetical protein C0599_10920 [Salinivirgaceae bacterium]